MPIAKPILTKDDFVHKDKMKSIEVIIYKNCKEGKHTVIIRKIGNLQSCFELDHIGIKKIIEKYDIKLPIQFESCI